MRRAMRGIMDSTAMITSGVVICALTDSLAFGLLAMLFVGVYGFICFLDGVSR